VAEINKNADLEVRCEKRRRGRSIVGLIFQIMEKPSKDVINVETFKQKFFRLLAMENINKKPTIVQMDFSAYSDADLNIFEGVKGYENDIKAEKKRRGII